MTTFNEQGFLEPGFHDWTLDEVHERLVLGFPRSETRRRLASGYERLIGVFARNELDVEQWLDGSFVSSRENPRDLDLVTIMEAQVYASLPEDVQMDVQQTYDRSAKAEFGCDSYFAIRWPDDNPGFDDWVAPRDYWTALFGYERPRPPFPRRVPKGIIRLQAGANHGYPESIAS